MIQLISFDPKSVTFAAGFGKDKWSWVVVNHRECHELLLPWRSTCNDVWFGCLREVDFWKMNGWNLTLPETNTAPEYRPSQKEIHLPTSNFQVLCWVVQGSLDWVVQGSFNVTYLGGIKQAANVW